MDRNDRKFIFQHILTKIYWKKYNCIAALQYFENELRHLCPLNPSQTPEISFSIGSKMNCMSIKSQSNLRPNSLQYLANEPLNVLKLIVDRILWTEMIEISFFKIFRQKYIEKNFYNCIAIPWKWVAPSMSLKAHPNTRNLFFDGFKNELRHLCPLNRSQIFEQIHCNTLLMNHWMFWLGWLMDVGRYEGVAPSMWAFAAWFWQMSGSCAIYVPKNDIFFFNLLHWFLPMFFLNIKLPFWDIDGATPTHSPKSGWECHIDGATPSYLPTSINQPNQNMLHRSESLG